MIVYPLKRDDNVQNDHVILDNYLNDIFYTKDKSLYTSFYNVGAVWQWTNESIKDYFVDDLKNKKVLSITAGGDHIIHAAIQNSMDITGFDINIFSKYIAKLKIEMIKTLPYEEFLRLKSVFTHEELYKIIEVNNIINNLDYKDIEFFNTLIKNINDKKNNICDYEALARKIYCENDLYNKNKLAYIKEDKYYLAQNNLKMSNIKYIDSAAELLVKNVDEKYDYIYLSNVLDRISDFNKQILLLHDLDKILNINGMIISYEIMTEDSLSTYLKENNIEFKNIFTNYVDNYFDTIVGKVCKYKKIR